MQGGHTDFQRPQETSLLREMCGHCSRCFHFPRPGHRPRPINIIFLFPCICIIHAYFYVRSKCVGACVFAHGGQRLMMSRAPFNFPSIFFIKSEFPKHTQSLTKASLASQFALMIPFLPSQAGITGWHSCSSAIYIGLWGPGLGSLYLHFNH